MTNRQIKSDYKDRTNLKNNNDKKTNNLSNNM